MTDRLNDWPARLWREIERWQAVPFGWGHNDCCLFAARVTDAICGSRHAARLAEHYDDEASALQYIKASGGIGPAVSQYIGEPEQKRPSRGDVVLFDGPHGDTLGVCVGAEIAAMGPDGVVYLPKSVVKMTWSV